MILEDIEQKCLSYLKQVSRPLVSLNQLVSYLRRQEGLGPFEEQDLLDFLKKHELFQVIESPFDGMDADRSRSMQEAGFEVGPFVILVTRIPSARELVEEFDSQIGVLLDALQKALQESQAFGEPKRVQELTVMIERAEGLREKFRTF